MVGQGFSTGGSTGKMNVLKNNDEISFFIDSPIPQPSFRGEQIDMDRAAKHFCRKPSARKSKLPRR